MTVFLIAVALSAACIPLVNRVAIALGIVAVTREDRWHTGASIPRLGGVAIAVATMLLIASSPWQWLAALTVAFLTGLRDDVRPLSVAGKLIPQVACAVMMIVSLPSIASGLLLPILAVLWIVFAMNMYNMLDNMDGTAASTGVVIALSMAIIALEVEHHPAAAVAFALAGAILGFLFFNIAPARVFMGDSGSHFIGATLALLALVLIEHTGPVILLLFLVPITDFTYVTLKRVRERRSIVVGGRDHLAHDLHRRGLSERKIVGIYAFASCLSGVVVWAII